MTNKSTKRALLSSVIAMLLCFSMLLGTTYAWFTDSVTSATNKIVAGNLDVELYHADKAQPTDELVGDTTKLFDDVTLWEPGAIVWEKFTVKNVGSLALKYNLSVNVNDISTVNGKSLADVLKIAVLDQMPTRENVAAAETKSLATFNLASGEILNSNESAEFYVAIYWAPSANDNDYNVANEQLYANLSVTLLATQYTYEADSFDNQYDKDATYGTYIELNAGDDLLAAMASAEAGLPLTIKLNGDVEWTTEGHNGVNDVTKASSVVIDGQGKYKLTATGAGVTAIGDTTAPITLKDLTVTDASVSYEEDSWEFGYLEITGVTCKNVVFTDPIMVEGQGASFENCTFTGYTDVGVDDGKDYSITMYGVWAISGTQNYVDCTFVGTRGMKVCDSNVSNSYATANVNVTIDGCTFDNLTEKPGVAIDYSGDEDISFAVTIKNSTFINCQPGDQNLYIYETDNTVPTVENNTVIGGTEIVDGVYENGTRNYYVYTAEGLQNVFAEVIPQNREQSQSVNLMADIDLTGIVWQPTGNMHFTFNGNNHTISNVTCAEGWRSGFFGYAGGVTVNDLTLENVISAGAQAGTFAGSAEGLRANNCFLKGTNTVTYVPYASETWGGVGAVTGVVASSNINVTIVEGATVTLNKSGLTTNCTYIDNLTGYLNTNSGTVVNNGTVKVIDLAIATADELFAFAKDVNENGKNYSGKTVALVANIDLENKAWTPIGQTGATTFNGSFDGQGYTIKNLYVDSSAQTGGNYSSGLFGWIEIHSTTYRVIENLNVDGATITGNHNCGTIVGYATGSLEIKNCNVTSATITCNVANNDANGDKAGVIAGNITAEPQNKVTGCTASNSTVTAGRDAGQLVGAGNVENVTGTATNVTVTANGNGTGANINNALVGRDL